MANQLRHVAIIMDGNGRWARSRGLERFLGHRKGTQATIDAVEVGVNLKLEHMTLYVFSSENWGRPSKEVDYLMNLLIEMVVKEIPDLMEKNVKLVVIGNMDRLPEKPRASLQSAIDKTANNTGMQLNLAISIFKGQYPKNFLHQLISSQLDMDRLDYLRRDSFYTGVTEGNIGSARIIKMLNVVDDSLVVDHKGIYSLENYLTTRRLMYWQVYLHRTCVAYEKVLVNMLTRAKDLIKSGQDVFASPALHYFLYNDVDKAWFDTHPEALANYEELDDSDIWCAMKAWKHHDDKILSTLATDMLDRHIFKVEVSEEPIEEGKIAEIADAIAVKMNITPEDAQHYLMSINTIQKDMYSVDDDSISILYKNGEIRDISKASELLNVQLLSKKIRKYYLCYQRFE